MTESLDGKVALVTGAGSGIGQASAMAFARAGARVVVSDINADGGEATVRCIKDAGGEATFIRADVTQAADVVALVAATVQAYGRLDCAHNNAGISGFTDTWTVPADYPEPVFDEVIAVNLKGVWLCLTQEIPRMLAQGRGAIVNTASVVGLVAHTGAAYVASKHGVIGLTKSFALAYAAQGLRINAICPGYIETPMVRSALTLAPELEPQVVAQHPVGRLGTPDEIAAAVVWLCSDAASFVTGHAMVADGGYQVP
jgi:NAD(P)-dependent dehydrogenase (short-subunit alcohol dehydrogenase family)